MQPMPVVLLVPCNQCLWIHCWLVVVAETHSTASQCLLVLECTLPGQEQASPSSSTHILQHCKCKGCGRMGNAQAVQHTFCCIANTNKCEHTWANPWVGFRHAHWLGQMSTPQDLLTSHHEAQRTICGTTNAGVVDLRGQTLWVGSGCKHWLWQYAHPS